MVLSSGQNGGGRGVIDKAPGEEELPMPQVEWRRLREEKLSAPLTRTPGKADTHTNAH